MYGTNNSSVTPPVHHKLADGLHELQEISVLDRGDLLNDSKAHFETRNGRFEAPSVASLKEILATPAPNLDFLLQGLVPTGKNVFIRVSAGVDAQQFALAVAFTVASGSNLDPFGEAEESGTLLVRRTGNRIRVNQQLKLLHDHCEEELARQLALANLIVKDSSEMLWDINFEELEDDMPADCQLVIFFDRYRFSNLDPKKFVGFVGRIEELNAKGIATLVFIHAEKKHTTELENRLISGGNSFWIELQLDPGAPRELGAGFTVAREKMCEFDNVPSRFQYWHTVIEGKLNIGWECREPSDPSTAKAVEIAERQIRVKQLDDQGISQKDIAKELGVNPATISRDMAQIKANKRNTHKPGEEDSEKS